MKTLYGLLAATLLLSFTGCSDSITREAFAVSDKAAKTEIGRYQLVAAGDNVFKIDTATGSTKVLGVVEGLLTFVDVVDEVNIDFPKGKDIPADDPLAKQYFEFLRQIHEQVNVLRVGKMIQGR